MLAAQIQSFDTPIIHQHQGKMNESTTNPELRPPLIVNDSQKLDSHLAHNVHDPSIPSLNHPLPNYESNDHIRRPSDASLGPAVTAEEASYGGLLGAAGSVRQRKIGAARMQQNHNQSMPPSIPNSKSGDAMRRRSSYVQTSPEPVSIDGMATDSNSNNNTDDSHMHPPAFSSVTNAPIPSPLPTNNDSTDNTATPSASFMGQHSDTHIITSESPPPAQPQQQESVFSYTWPIIFAVTPPVMNLVFGSNTIWGELFLLLLTALYLYFVIKFPWEMYYSVRSRKCVNRVGVASHMQHFVRSDGQTTIDVETMSQSCRNAAQKQLKRLERCYLALIVASPFLGGLGLYITRHLLSDPNQLISEFNIVLFVVAAGVRPLMFIMKLAKNEATRLQEEVNYPSTEVDSLRTRVSAIENHLAIITEAVASKSDLYALKVEHEASLAPLSRAIRRMEKRTDQLRAVSEESIITFEGRLREVLEAFDKYRGGDLALATTQPQSPTITSTSNGFTSSVNHDAMATTASSQLTTANAGLNGGPIYTLYTAQAPGLSRFNSSASRSRSPANLMSCTTAIFVLTTWLVSMVGYIITRCALFPLNLVGGVVGGVIRLLPAPSTVTSPTTTSGSKSSNNPKVMTDILSNGKYRINGSETGGGSKRGNIQLDHSELDRIKHSLRA